MKSHESISVAKVGLRSHRRFNEETAAMMAQRVTALDAYRRNEDVRPAPIDFTDVLVWHDGGNDALPAVRRPQFVAR